MEEIRVPALVLDFGGPVLLTPFELVAAPSAVTRHAAARGLLHRRGPLAPAGDPDRAWEDVAAGRTTERRYWDDRAEEWHRAGGGEPDVRALIAPLYEPPRPELVRDQAHSLARDARAAGMPVGILTNDLRAFHSADWIERMDFLSEVDVIVDGSVEGHLKPAPRLYELLSERLGVADRKSVV